MLASDVQRDHVPSKPGVYLFKTTWGKILYIWKAKSLKKRVRQYFTPWSLWKQDMVAKAWYVEFFEVVSEQESLLLETNLISAHKPPYNNLIKGDTSYVYIKIAREPFPNIQLTRYKYNDKAIYIGPKVRRRELKELLQLLRHVFQWRQCGSMQFREGHVCSDYFFGLCKGWCVYAKMHDNKKQDNVPSDVKSEIKSEVETTAQKTWFFPVYQTRSDAEQHYQEIVRYLTKFFEGESEELLVYMRREIDEAIEKQHFEWAAKLRDMYFKIELVTQRQTVTLPEECTGTFGMIERVQWGLLVVLIKLHKWRMIDIIWQHLIDDEYDEVLRQLEREYQLTLLEEQDTYTLLWYGAARLRKDEKELLQSHATTFGYSYLQSHMQNTHEITSYLLERLRKTYHLHRLPVHIECVDISHLSWSYTAWGLVAMQHGQLFKAGYKRFEITTERKHDDYAALTEVLVRRFGLGKAWIQEGGSVQGSESGNESEKQLFPDMFILDGGKQQLSLVQRILEQFPESQKLLYQVQFCSLGKWKARKRAGKVQWEQEVLWVLNPSWEMHANVLQYDDADRLLIRLRDEAHRFANAYRKKLMQKDWK